MEGYKKQDPIENVRLQVLEKEWATEEDLQAIDDDVRKEVEEAVNVR